MAHPLRANPAYGVTAHGVLRMAGVVAAADESGEPLEVPESTWGAQRFCPLPPLASHPGACYEDWSFGCGPYSRSDRGLDMSGMHAALGQALQDCSPQARISLMTAAATHNQTSPTPEVFAAAQQAAAA